MERIFTYGTLRSGEGANYLLGPDAVLVGEFETKEKYLRHYGGRYPMVIKDVPDDHVTGEVWEVSCMDAVDRYEGHPHLFKREVVELSDDSEAWLYFFNGDY